MTAASTALVALLWIVCGADAATASTTDPAPTDPVAVSTAPGDSATDPAPTTEPTDPAPTDPAPTEPAPTESPTLAPTVGPTDPATPAPVSPRLAPPADEGTDATGDALQAQAVVPSTARIAGAEQYTMAVNASKAAYPSGASTVVVTTGTYPVYGVISTPLAAQLDAPVLFAEAGSVPAQVLTELRRLSPTRIVVVGSTAYVSEAVVNTLKTVTAAVTRVNGADVYEVSRKVFAAQTASAGTVYVSNLLTTDGAPLTVTAAASASARTLLVNGKLAAAEAATLTALRSAGTRSVVVVGSTGVVTAAYETSLRSAGFTVSRITAADGVALSIAVANARGQAPQRLIVVNRVRPQDLAVATSLAAGTRQPLLYAQYGCLPNAVASYASSAGAPLTLVGDTYWLDAGVAAGSSCSTVAATRNAQLKSALEAVANSYDGTFYVTAREVGGVGELDGFRGGTRVEPASMMKIFAAWGVLKIIEGGRGSGSTKVNSHFTIVQCLKAMIHGSDNYCHSDLVHWAGAAKLNSLIKAAGFTSTSYGHVTSGSVLYAGNRTTTNDISLMLSKIASGSMLNAVHTSMLMGWLKSQIYRSRIGSGIPSGIVQASKPGSLWIASGLLQADTAIVYGPRSTFVLSVVGTGGIPKSAISAMARVAYTHFNGSFGTAMSYPAKQMVTTGKARIRTAPWGSVVRWLPAGYALEVVDAKWVWYQVRYGTRLLWVDSNSLKNKPPY